MTPSMALKRGIAFATVWQALIETTSAKGLATITPCPDCRPSIAPKPVIITAQYQTVSTCEPSTTTVLHPYTKVETVPSCSPYAWVSTTIPVYNNGTKTSSVVTSTNQPVTFNSLHYTETHSTTVTLPAYYPQEGKPTYNLNGTYPKSTVKVSYTTIDVKDYCDYNSIGPIAIPGYKGSNLCSDCGPDASSALTQRFTVVSCANKHCTTFNETWISSPKTYSSEGQIHTTATTNTYCPTATPETAIPGYTHPAPTGPSSSAPTSAGSYPSHSSPSSPSKAPQSTSGSSPSKYSKTVSEAHPSSYATHPAPTYPAGPTSTDEYDAGTPDPSADPSGDLGYEPAPTPYHQKSPSYKVFKRQGLEKPRGRVMKRSGLLFFGDN